MIEGTAGLLAYGLLTVLALAAAWDIRTFTIPNLFPIAAAVLFGVAAAMAGLSLGGWAVHLGTGAAALAGGFALFLARLFGGGDVKLFAATALWVHISHFIIFLVFVALAGAVLALVTIVFVAGRQIAGTRSIDLKSLRTVRVPYGVAILAGYGGLLLVDLPPV